MSQGHGRPGKYFVGRELAKADRLAEMFPEQNKNTMV